MFDKTQCGYFLEATIVSFYRLMAKDELVALLQKCVVILSSSKSKKMKAALGQLQNYLAKFDQLDSTFTVVSHVMTVHLFIIFNCTITLKHPQPSPFIFY